MSLALIRKAMETRLAAAPGSLPTAYENTDFTPVLALPYQRANLLPNDPDDRERGTRGYTERGLFQITLSYPYGKGSGAAGAYGNALRSHFKRGLTLVEGSLQIHVIHTPAVTPASIDEGRYVVAITVSWQCYVNVI